MRLNVFGNLGSSRTHMHPDGAIWQQTRRDLKSSRRFHVWSQDPLNPMRRWYNEPPRTLRLVLVALVRRCCDNRHPINQRDRCLFIVFGNDYRVRFLIHHVIFIECRKTPLICKGLSNDISFRMKNRANTVITCLPQSGLQTKN